MTPEQIKTWAATGESETIEFKRTTNERREAVRTLCAMLNHRGGRVLFGVDAGGAAIGQQVSDHTIEEIAQEIKELDPPAFPTIDRVDVGGGREVIVMTVIQGSVRPYSYADAGIGQVFRIRPGSAMEETIEQQLGLFRLIPALFCPNCHDVRASGRKQPRHDGFLPNRWSSKPLFLARNARLCVLHGPGLKSGVRWMDDISAIERR